MNDTMMFAIGICVGAGVMIFLWIMHCTMNATTTDDTKGDK